MVSKLKNREFGLVVCLVLGIFTMLGHVKLPCIMVVLLVTLLFPKFLSPFTWMWFRLGEGVNIVMGKLLLVLIFFLVVTPVGVVRRMTDNDMMRLRQFKKSKGSVFSLCRKEYDASHLMKQY